MAAKKKKRRILIAVLTVLLCLSACVSRPTKTSRFESCCKAVENEVLTQFLQPICLVDFPSLFKNAKDPEQKINEESQKAVADLMASVSIRDVARKHGLTDLSDPDKGWFDVWKRTQAVDRAARKRLWQEHGYVFVAETSRWCSPREALRYYYAREVKDWYGSYRSNMASDITHKHFVWDKEKQRWEEK